MIEIALQEIQKYYGSNHVLKGVSFEVKTGERLGLLGRNGAGKTTVFRMISGCESPDGGELMVRKGAAIGVLNQIPEFPADWTVSDVLYSAYGDLLNIRRQMTELEERLADTDDMEKNITCYGRLQQIFEARQGYSMEQVIDRLCINLGFLPDFLTQKFCLLSGGEKTKVVLGKTLLENPDILLLDEPTNHLDVAAIEWLEEFLQEYKGTAMIISHDRYFLDKAVTGVVELVDGKAEIYRGGYSCFAAEKKARYEQQLEKYNQQQKKIRQLEAAAKRLHEWGRQVDNPGLHRQAFNIEKRIERMEKTEKPVETKRLNAGFGQQRFSGEEVIAMQAVAKSFDGKVVLRDATFMVRRGGRAALIGENGSGKSTLLKLIIAETAPEQGTVKLGASIRCGYLPQVIHFDEADCSVLDMARIALQLAEGDARRVLAKYHFKNESVQKRLDTLSGGEKSRLYLCFLMQRHINLLILDEPTNHLDIESREWLEEALSEFSGTVLFVSHDRYFINKFAQQVLEIKDGKVIEYAGGYQFYRNKKKESQAFLEKVPAVAGAKPVVLQPDFAPVRKKQDAREQLENMIRELEQILQELESQMIACSDHYAMLDKLFREKTEIEKNIEVMYQQWINLAD